MIPFTDKSHHQGLIDWDAFVAAAPEIPGVIIRAGNGQSKDRQVDRNMAEAERVGLLRSAYWFANPKAPISGAGQGRLLAEAHHRYGCELPPMWDAEGYEAEGGPNPVLAGAPAARWQADMARATDVDSGRLSLGYSGASWWNRMLTPGVFDRALGRFTDEWRADLEFLYSHDFILARYPGQHRVPPIVGKIVDYLPRDVAPAAWPQVFLATGKEPPRLAGRARDWDAWQVSAGGNAQGPVYGCQSSDLDLNIARTEAWARWTATTIPVPTPAPAPIPEGDDDMIRLLVLTDSPVRLLAMCTPQGAALRCEWTGPGDQSGSNPRIEWFRKAHPAPPTTGVVVPSFEMTGVTTGHLINISLDGVLPPGLQAEQFANTDEINARMTTGTVDTVARKVAAELNDGLGRLNQEVHEVKTNLRKAGGG